MGMSSGRGEAGPKGVASEINVTPLIDVLLVLLIIFLVVMPIMTKVEPLQVPRKLDGHVETSDQTQLVLEVRNDLSIAFSDGSSDSKSEIQAIDIARTLRPKLEAWTSATPKVVFVAFEDDVPWTEVVATMDSVRSLATDTNHDEIAVALKLPEDEGSHAR
jgi:biopolymer transport protein ExbD